MLGAVHAGVGAAAGALCNSRTGAFAAGLVSHLVIDAIPHSNLKPEVEVALTAGVMAAVAKWKGMDSPEFWGAVGGTAPDLEHGLVMAGLARSEQQIFPTHRNNGAWHGREDAGVCGQVLLAAASLLFVALKGRS